MTSIWVYQSCCRSDQIHIKIDSLPLIKRIPYAIAACEDEIDILHMICRKVIGDDCWVDEDEGVVCYQKDARFEDGRAVQEKLQSELQLQCDTFALKYLPTPRDQYRAAWQNMSSMSRFSDVLRRHGIHTTKINEMIEYMNAQGVQF